MSLKQHLVRIKFQTQQIELLRLYRETIFGFLIINSITTENKTTNNKPIIKYKTSIKIPPFTFLGNILIYIMKIADFGYIK